MEEKRPGFVVIKKNLVRELNKDPYWREKLQNAESTSGAIRVIREFGNAKGYSTNVPLPKDSHTT